VLRVKISSSRVPFGVTTVAVSPTFLFSSARPIGEFAIDLPRPRDVAEIRLTPEFQRIHTAIWETMRDEVLKGYNQHERG